MKPLYNHNPEPTVSNTGVKARIQAFLKSDLFQDSLKSPRSPRMGSMLGWKRRVWGGPRQRVVSVVVYWKKWVRWQALCDTCSGLVGYTRLIAVTTTHCHHNLHFSVEDNSVFPVGVDQTQTLKLFFTPFCLSTLISQDTLSPVFTYIQNLTTLLHRCGWDNGSGHCSPVTQGTALVIWLITLLLLQLSLLQIQYNSQSGSFKDLGEVMCDELDSSPVLAPHFTPRESQSPHNGPALCGVVPLAIPASACILSPR